MDGTKNTGTGLLIVQVSTADQSLPIAGVNVIVTKNTPNGEELVKVMQTGRDGKTPPLALSTPPAENSLTPENLAARFYNYNIRVDYPGFYTMENLNVPVFEGQTSIQPFALIPLPLGEEQGKKISVVEEEPEL